MKYRVKVYIYMLFRAIRFFRFTILDSLSTLYYKIVCKKFGKNSLVKWGSWIQYPYNVEIYDNVIIGRFVSIGSEFPNSQLILSSDIQINDWVSIDFSGNMMISSGCLFSEFVKIYSHSHGSDPRSSPIPLPKTIGKNCWFGVNVIILEKCLSICDNVIVGAGGIASKSITEPGIYVGNSLRMISSR